MFKSTPAPASHANAKSEFTFAGNPPVGGIESL
jgi:hypothetical protein